MPPLPVITGKDFVRILQMMGFIIARIHGSHIRLKHPDGRVTTVPIHGNKDIPKGLLRKIIREDLDLDLEEFLSQYERITKSE